MQVQDVTRLPEVNNDFEQAPLPANGKTKADATNSQESAFPSVSRKTAAAAKKGETSGSRTGKGKQVTYEFSKPPKNLFIKVHPSPGYSKLGLAVYNDENTSKFHFVRPDLYESGELPERFKNACKIMDVYTAGAADGTFFLWFLFESASPWFKAAQKTVDLARRNYGVVSSIKQRQTYSFEVATEAIPEPKWESLPPFEQLLLGAFDSAVAVADDKVVTDFMSGGVANREEEDEE
jgi:hypothetical protein